MNEEKEKIRQQALKHRVLLTLDPDAPERMVTRFLEAIPDIDNKIIALYWPIQNEMDTYPLIEELLKRKNRICLPKIKEPQTALIFLQWDGKEPLIKSQYETRSPVDRIENRVIPDIIIVPLVAFDRTGMRLGYGQGYYDRTLKQLKKEEKPLITVGYAFDQQLCLFPLPKEPHDQRLDIIITPSKTY